MHTYITRRQRVNTLRPKQNGSRFADDVFKCIFVNGNICILAKMSLKFVPKGPINNIPALVQVMAWRRSGDKPLSEPLMVRSPTHIYVTWPPWVNISGRLICLFLFDRHIQFRADFRFAHSQWEASLQSNAVSNRLGVNLESALQLPGLSPEWIVYGYANTFNGNTELYNYSPNHHIDIDRSTEIFASWNPWYIFPTQA